MNPTARKMFKSRDARTKLRGMGGILASSPELAQTVQEFQDGGVVTINQGLTQSGQPLMERHITPFQTPAMGGNNYPFQEQVRSGNGLQGGLAPGLTQYGGYLEQKYGNPQFEQKKDAFLHGVYQKEQQTFGGMGGFSQPETPSYMIGPGGVGQPLFGGVGRQLFSDGGDVDAGFGSNVEYTYSTFLAENNLNDTPQAREMFAKYKVYMDTRDPLTDPQLFSSVGFDRAPARLAGPPVQFEMYQDTVRGSDMGNDRPFFSRFENDIYSMGEPLNVGQRRMGYGDTRSIGPQRPGGTDAAFTRQTTPAAPLSTLDQLRGSVYSNNPLEDALANTGLNSNVIGDYIVDPITGRIKEIFAEDAARNERLASGDIDLPFGLGSGSAEAPTPKDNRRGYDAPASQGLRDLLAEREAYAADTAAREARVAEASSENAGRLTSEELMSPDPVSPTVGSSSRRSRRQNTPQPVNPLDVISDLFAPEGPGSGGRNIPRNRVVDDVAEADSRTAQEFRDAEAALATAQGMPSPGAKTPVVEPPAPAPAPVTTTETETAADAPVVTEEVVRKVADPKIQEQAAALAPSPDDTEDDLRTKYEARAKLFQEILGEDEAGARNKGMDLAMIGLAIMSGQSPNALTNIAQGGAAGLKAMSARDEAARERQRLVRTTALESVIEEEAAKTAAAATAAEKELDRANVLEAARIRSRGTATQAAARNLASIADDAAKAAGEVFNDPIKRATSDVKMDKDGKPLESQAEYELRKAIEAQDRAYQTDGNVYGANPRFLRKIEDAKDNPDMLAAIRESLITRGMNLSLYGFE